MAVPPGPPAPSAGDVQELNKLYAAMSEAHLILHAPPDLTSDAEILGICGVSTANADQHKYGWIVADFLHWKMLFHNVGPALAQTWYSSLDIPQFLAGVDGVDMINDGTIDKIVGNHKEDILPLPVDGEGFVAAFLKRLATSAISAVSRNTALFLMVFAPITPEQDICVDFAGKIIYLTRKRLRDTVNDAVGGVQLPVVFMTLSPFTGGWSCQPLFMNRPSCPTPDSMMRTIAKSCGAAFANRFMETFTKRNTPLMTRAQRENVKFEDPMPLRPSQLQTDCLYQLQRKIHESLEHRFAPFALDHAFIMKPEASRDPSEFSDAWLGHGVRQGRSIDFWAKHWESPRPTVTDALRFEFLGEAFGGTMESQLFHLRYLTAIELDTHPGDWTRQVGGITRELFTSFQQKLAVSEDDAKRVLDTVEFRASSMILAQMVANAFDLPLPDGVSARYWHDRIDGVDDGYYKKLQTAFGEIRDLFGQVAVLPSERRHDYKHVRFWRAARWLSAAIALRFEQGSRNDVVHFVLNEVAPFIAKIQDTQKDLLLKNRDVTRAGLNWVAALGLGGEVQLPADTATTAPATTTLQEPVKETRLNTWKNPKPAATSSVLDAQAAPWPAWADWKPAAKRPVSTFAEAESSLTQSDLQHAVEDVLEDFGAQPTASNEQHAAQSLEKTATPNPIRKSKAEARVPVTVPVVTSANIFGLASAEPLPPTTRADGVLLDLDGGRPEGSRSINDNARPQEQPASQVAARGVKNEKVAAPKFSSIDDVSSWDQILNKPVDIRTQGDNEAKVATHELPATPAVRHDEGDKKPVTSPKTMVGKTGVSSEAAATARPFMTDNSGVSRQAAATAQNPEYDNLSPSSKAAVRHAFLSLFQEVAPALSSQDADNSHVRRFMMKALELWREDQAEPSSTLQETPPVNGSSHMADEKHNAGAASTASAQTPAANSAWLPLTANDSATESGRHDEKARTCPETPATFASHTAQPTPGFTAGHSRIGSPSNSAKSFSTRASSEIADCDEGWGVAQKAPAPEDTKVADEAAAAPAPAAHAPAAPAPAAQPKLAEDDFWTLAGIKW